MKPTIAAVKYACNGEAKKDFEVPVYKTYNLKFDHPIFEQGEVSELSLLIGMPLVVMPLRPSLLAIFRPRNARHRHINGRDRQPKPLTPAGGLIGEEDEKDWTAYANYGSKEDAPYFPNETAARLMIVCSASSTTPLMSSPAKWIDKVGSVLIARQDMTPLHPMHIEVLKKFIMAIHEEMTERTKTQDLTAKLIAETATPDMWRAYWKMATEYMQETGQVKELEGVPTQFDHGDGEAVTAAEDHDEVEGGVSLGCDPDMMDCSDLGFTQ